MPGKLALEGQTAAHGQITERKYSVARMNNKVIRFYWLLLDSSGT